MKRHRQSFTDWEDLVWHNVDILVQSIRFVIYRSVFIHRRPNNKMEICRLQSHWNFLAGECHRKNKRLNTYGNWLLKILGLTFAAYRWGLIPQMIVYFQTTHFLLVGNISWHIMAIVWWNVQVRTLSSYDWRIQISLIRCEWILTKNPNKSNALVFYFLTAVFADLF